MATNHGLEMQGPAPPSPGPQPSGAGPTPPGQPSWTYTPPGQLGGGWGPQPTPVRMPEFARGLDLGLLVSGLGALLTLIGFLCGAAATGALGSGGSASAYQAWLEAFFVITGIGIFLTVGGWIYRTALATRQASR